MWIHFFCPASPPDQKIGLAIKDKYGGALYIKAIIKITYSITRLISNL